MATLNLWKIVSFILLLIEANSGIPLPDGTWASPDYIHVSNSLSAKDLSKESWSPVDVPSEPFLSISLIPRCNLNDYTIVKNLGSGKDGTVSLIERKLTDEKFALKTTHQDPIQELSIFEKMSTELEEDHWEFPQIVCEAHEQNQFIMEWVPGETLGMLVQRLEADGSKTGRRKQVISGLTNSQFFKFISVSMVNTLLKLHQIGICHADAHLNNWIFETMDNSKIRLVLVDFSRSKTDTSDYPCGFEISALARRLRTLFGALVGGEPSSDLEYALTSMSLPLKERPPLSEILRLPFFQ